MGAWSSPSPPPTRIRRITEPAIAVVAPTLMSCPPQAAVTRVIPMARMATSEPLSRIVIRYPLRTGSPALLVPMVIEKNPGSRIRLKTARMISATIGMNICIRNRREIPPGLFNFFSAIMLHLLQSSP